MIPLDRYPKEITLRDGVLITLRPMAPEDAERTWEFFRRLPEIDKAHFQENVDDRGVVEGWAGSLDFESALPILAFEGDRIVGGATLYRNKTGWKKRVGTVRIMIAPDYRHRGLGTAMIREIRRLGEQAALNYIVAEVVEEQQDAIRALERMGFERAVVYRNFANDRAGRLHNLVVLLYPMVGPSEDTFY